MILLFLLLPNQTPNICNWRMKLRPELPINPIENKWWYQSYIQGLGLLPLLTIFKWRRNTFQKQTSPMVYISATTHCVMCVRITHPTPHRWEYSTRELNASLPGLNTLTWQTVTGRCVNRDLALITNLVNFNRCRDISRGYSSLRAQFFRVQYFAATVLRRFKKKQYQGQQSPPTAIWRQWNATLVHILYKSVGN